MEEPLNETQVANRRKKVADLREMGHSQEQIAAELGISQATVSRDLNAFNAEVNAATVHNLTELLNRQLHKLDLLEAESWAAWRRSREPARSASITETGKGTETNKGTKKVSSLKHGPGDPRFLDMVRKCIAQRCKLLGLELPAKRSAPAAVSGSASDQDAFLANIPLEDC